MVAKLCLRLQIGHIYFSHNKLLVRRVRKRRLRKDPGNEGKNCYPKLLPRLYTLGLPHQLDGIDARRRNPEFNPWLAKVYEHEYIEGKTHDGETVYSSVSYWRFYNRGSDAQDQNASL